MKKRIFARAVGIILISACILSATSCNLFNKKNDPASLGIGYGYNFIDDEYFDSNNKSVNSVLDLDALLKIANVEETNAQESVGKGISGDSITEYSENYNSAMEAELGLKFPVKMFTASISASMKISNAVDFSDYQRALFYNYTNYYEYKNYELKNYGEQAILSDYLSSNFKNVLNRTSRDVVGMTDEELAAYIYDNYGTHVILGVITGGKLEYNFVMATNNTSLAEKMSEEYSMGVGFGYKDIASVNMSMGTSEEFSTSASSNETVGDTTFNIYGGSTEGLTPSNIQEQYMSWSSSINDSNARSVAISHNGSISISDIVRYIDPALADAINAEIEKRALAAQEALKEEYELDPNSLLGAKDNPYIIETLEDLKDIPSVDGAGVHFSLANDIQMPIDSWTNIHDLKGIFNGNGHKISGLRIYYESSGEDAKTSFGLFGNVSGSINDLIIDEANITVKKHKDGQEDMYIGAVCGKISGGSLSNVVVINSQIAGQHYRDVDASSSNVKVQVGAIAGVIESTTVKSCYAQSNYVKGITDMGEHDGNAHTNVGGIVGELVGSAQMEQCISMGNQIVGSASGGASDNILGIMGEKADLYNRAGGIIGYVGPSAVILKCYEESNSLEGSNRQNGSDGLEVNDLQRGGIAGRCDGKIESSLYSSAGSTMACGSVTNVNSENLKASGLGALLCKEIMLRYGFTEENGFYIDETTGLPSHVLLRPEVTESTETE